MSVGGPVRLTATGQVKTGGGAILGFYVNSTTTGTIVLWDSLSAAGNQVTGTITPGIGWHPLPLKFGVGLHCVIANTLDVTFIVAR
jgi:hypothetical protein